MTSPLADYTQSRMSPFDEMALRLLLESFGRKDLKILEIGSWLGAGSTQIFADYASKLVCVDHWRGNNTPAHNELVGAVNVFDLFLRNTERFRDKVVVVFSDSTQIGNLFAPGHFDLVFIDGDHRYEQTRQDILNTLELVRPGGILSGHDCEGRLTSHNRDALHALLGQDHADSAFTRFREMHPGVIVAVDELVPSAVLFAEHELTVGAAGEQRKGSSTIWYAQNEPALA